MVAQVLQPKPPRSLCVNVRVRVPQFVQHFHHFKLTNNVQKKRVSLGPTRPCIQTSQKQKSKDILGYKAPKWSMSFQYFQIMIGTGSCIHVNHVYHQHGPSTPISRTCQISTRFLCTCTRRWRVSCILTIRCSPNNSFAPTGCLGFEGSREKPRETESDRKAYVVKFRKS